MKTDELIAMLARDAGSVEPGMPQRRYAAALGWGAFGATLLMAVMLGVRRATAYVSASVTGVVAGSVIANVIDGWLRWSS